MNSWLLMSMGIVIGAAVSGLGVWVVLRLRRAAQSAAPETSTGPVAAAEPPASIEWTIGDMKIGEVTRFVPTPTTVREAMPLDPRLQEGLQVLFQEAPVLAAPSEEASQNHFVLRFSSQVSQGIVDGSLKLMSLMKGGLYGKMVDTRNRILDHASLGAVGTVGSAATAVWQVM
ncbi:hypothetical protein, partial [Hyalangium sp.]|uniref:hypothetical protein n=1 Tax=Hyalangium sp. TaxID=2028555 RepID=UPI002D59D5E1